MRSRVGSVPVLSVFLPLLIFPCTYCSTAAGAEGSLGNLIRLVTPSIVRVEAEKKIRTESVLGEFLGIEEGKYDPGTVKVSDSGFFWDGKGHVLTVMRVVEEAEKIRVVDYRGKVFPAVCLGADPGTGVAVLKTEGLENPKVRPLGEVRLGGRVAAGGYASGTRRPFFSCGIVSDLRAPVRGVVAGCIQSDVSTPSGMGGGPLFSMRGRVVGLNLAFEGADPGQGVSYAVPGEELERVVPVLLRGEIPKRGGLGLTVACRDGKVTIIGFTENSPAEKAGLKKGDLIVKAAGGEIRSLEDMTRVAGRTSPGETISIEIDRGGKLKLFKVKTCEWKPAARDTVAFRIFSAGELQLTPASGRGGAAGRCVLKPIVLVPETEAAGRTGVRIEERGEGKNFVAVEKTARGAVIRFRGRTYYGASRAFGEAIKAAGLRNLTIRISGNAGSAFIRKVVERLKRSGVREMAVSFEG